MKICNSRNDLVATDPGGEHRGAVERPRPRLLRHPPASDPTGTVLSVHYIVSNFFTEHNTESF